MDYYLYMVQNGVGCDHTIACGEKLIKLAAHSVADAESEVEEIVRGQDWNFDEIDTVKVLEVSADATFDHKQYLKDL